MREVTETENLRCVISDLCDQVRERDAELERLRDKLQKAEVDASRLDFLDGNARMNMGWQVGEAPAGNLSISSVIQIGKPVTSIRAAIDNAMEKFNDH